MENKNNLYKNNLNKVFHNNREIYMSNDRENTNKIWNSNDIRSKINNIINGNDFIYQTKVNILIGNEIITRKIIGIYNNNLVTIDNEYIPIDTIKDIYK